jgi:RimJ/RimL family protein N-acetyltransferase
VLDHGFARGGLDRIVALTEPSNPAARKFALKLGFRGAEPVVLPNGSTREQHELRRTERP